MPSKAVMRKFADVLVIDTFVVDGAAVNARVKSAHIITLQRTFRPRHILITLLSTAGVQEVNDGIINKQLTPLKTNMKTGWPSATPGTPKRDSIAFAKVVVSSSVVLFAVLAPEVLPTGYE
jgi:hypothetical protein